MSKLSDSKKQSPKKTSEKCSFCSNDSDLYAFKVIRGVFSQYHFCESCASSLEPDPLSEPNLPRASDLTQSKGKKVSEKCFCCETSREQIISTGVFPCQHCYDSFPELEELFPEKFKANSNLLERMIIMSALKDKVEYTENLLKKIPKEKIGSELYKETIEKLKQAKEQIRKFKENE